MSHVIWKYPFGDKTAMQMPWPPGSRVVLIAAQNRSDPTPVIWVDHPVEPVRGLHEPQAFDLIGTGYEYRDRLGYEHVGSVVCADGALVWHVFSEQVA